jgi:polysaccharide pyruvyl transferase WcaK-like protein
MRILLDQAVHDHRNQGNNALLDVALKRFRTYWPDAEINIISIAPHLCRLYFPDAFPVSPVTLEKHSGRIDVLHKPMLKPVWRLLFEMRDAAVIKKAAGSIRRSRQAPRLPDDGTYQAGGDEPLSPVDTDEYRHMADYDLYVPTGAGYMCDSDKQFLLKVFDRLEKAVELGVSTVMVGQGIGPMEDRDLIRRGREVLPHVDYIMIREERFARSILNMLGVPPEKIYMTGDDAIEPAYQARMADLGRGFGLSLRLAHYTKVNAETVKSLKPLIIQKAKQYNAKLIPVPIDINDADKKYVDDVISGYRKADSSWSKFDTYTALIERTRKCRVMITGTFHAAVFAVSQGIPVIALANSTEYMNKTLGLTAEFGEDGCRVISLSDPDFERRFSEAVDHAWASADELRPQLLEAARRQISLGHLAYQKIYSLVEARKNSLEPV